MIHRSKEIFKESDNILGIIDSFLLDDMVKKHNSLDLVDSKIMEIIQDHFKSINEQMSLKNNSLADSLSLAQKAYQQELEKQSILNNKIVELNVKIDLLEDSITESKLNKNFITL